MVTHHIITNREISTRKGRNFIAVNDKEYIRIDGDEEAHHNLRYGKVSFDPDKAKKLKDFKIDIHPDPDDDTLEKHREGENITLKEFGSTKVFTELYNSGKKATEREDILVFVHGFKSDLETALCTLRYLHQRYVEAENSPIKHIVLFTWPARKKILKYRSDAQDATISGFALARSFASLRDFFRTKFIKEREGLCEQKIHLMCHSMGNRVLECMIAGLMDIGVEVNSLFGEIILMGADVDYDSLERPKPLYRLIDLGERVHVYFHNKDQALGVSELSKNAFNRLGRWGAKNSLNLADDIYQNDVSDIQDDNGLVHAVVHHWYYTNSKAVVGDIIDIFNGKSSVFNF